MIIQIEQRPPSVNSFYGRTRFGSTYIKDKGREFQDYVRWQLKSTPHYHFGTLPIKLKIDYEFKGKRKLDIDNYIKPLIDSLKVILFDDDEQINELHVTKKYTDRNLITIEITQNET